MEKKMKGDAKVLELLNDCLTAELTAINQYFIHAEICENLGYSTLYKAIRAESIDEMKHADKLIERILFLEGYPNMSRYFEIRVGKSIEEIFKYDMKLEQDAVARLNKGIGLCAEVGDHGSRDLLQGILHDEERHVDFIETQQSLIEQLGIVNYLSRQMGGGED
jgi:bacterioferritin